jgi:hypothetical protein
MEGYYLRQPSALVMGVRDKTIEDAAGNDMKKALELLNSLHKKITYEMNT